MLKDFLTYISSNIIQLAALVLGVAEVVLALFNNVWLYPTGIASILLTMYSLLTTGLYADCLLHLYYLVMSIYGWMYWTRRQGDSGVKVTMSSKNEWYIAIVISFGGWLLLYLLLITVTPSEIPLWDSWVSATGCAGMWLLARRKVENWIFLNVSNAFAIPLLIHKDLKFLAVLTSILFVVACVGYFDWRKIARKQSMAI
jgi:nicotinamide mononucleotide transporter